MRRRSQPSRIQGSSLAPRVTCPPSKCALSKSTTAPTYSLGAILYEMLSGQQAFGGGSVAETMVAILREDPPELSKIAATIPPAIERIVHHCLEKSRDDRFQSARDVAFALRALTGVSADPGAASPGPRSRWVTSLVTAVLLVGAMSAGLLLGRARRAPDLTFQRLTFRGAPAEPALPRMSRPCSIRRSSARPAIDSRSR